MADLPPLRAPGAPPSKDEGSKLHFTIPGGALGSMAFLLVQLVGVVIWAANEHSQRIELQHNFEEFKDTMKDRARTIEMSLDRLDTNGSRQVALIQDRQNSNVARANQMEDRLTSTFSRLNSHGEFIAKLDRRLDDAEKNVLLLQQGRSPPAPPSSPPPP